MPTSTRFAVSTHILAALALNRGNPLSSERIAASAATHPALVRRLLQRLTAAGLACARHGQGGGALLARPPAEITLLDVFRAVEDEDLFLMHRGTPDPGCIVGRNIQPVLADATRRASGALERELTATTIADIAAAIRERAPLS